MKKTGIILLIIFAIIISSNSSLALDYTSFEEIQFLDEFKLINEFTDEQIEAYYEKVSRRKFSGWNTYIINKDKRVTYISETLYSYYNNGQSSIDYHYKSKTKELRQYDLAVSGSIGITDSKNEKTFKNGLTKSLKIDLKAKIQKEIQEEQDFKLKIEPKTKLSYYYYGEGKITNGVAARYQFFIRKNIGCFEVFTVTTHYPRLEILPI